MKNTHVSDQERKPTETNLAETAFYASLNTNFPIEFVHFFTQCQSYDTQKNVH